MGARFPGRRESAAARKLPKTSENFLRAGTRPALARALMHAHARGFQLAVGSSQWAGGRLTREAGRDAGDLKVARLLLRSPSGAEEPASFTSFEKKSLT